MMTSRDPARNPDPIIRIVRRHRWLNGDIGFRFYRFRESYTGRLLWRPYRKPHLWDWIEAEDQKPSIYHAGDYPGRLRHWYNLGDGNRWHLPRVIP
jgi:hypothetical protein